MFVLRISVKGTDLLPVSSPALGNHRIFFAPGTSFELAEPLGGRLHDFGPVNPFEFARQGLAFFPATKGQTIAVKCTNPRSARWLTGRRW